MELCGFVPKFFPLYHLITSSDGQYFGGFSGGNAQARTNFDRRPEVFSWWPGLTLDAMYGL